MSHLQKAGGISIQYDGDFKPKKSETSDEWVAGLLKRDESFAVPPSLENTEKLSAFFDELHKIASLRKLFPKAHKKAKTILKKAFSESQYGGTGGYVSFGQVSQIPAFKQPSLTENPLKKKVAGMLTPSGLTPAARLSSSQSMMQPKVTAPSGPSIGDIAKPHGYGTKIPGATK